MKQFPEMWIPCTEQEYPEVKQLLEGMGFREFDTIWFAEYKGVISCAGGTFQSHFRSFNHPTVTLPELREMAAEPAEPEPDNLAALETLFANFIEAVAEMRAAQRKYEKTPRTFRPEVLGIRLKHEREVDAMIEDVTRKPKTT